MVMLINNLLNFFAYHTLNVTQVLIVHNRASQVFIISFLLLFIGSTRSIVHVCYFLYSILAHLGFILLFTCCWYLSTLPIHKCCCRWCWGCTCKAVSETKCNFPVYCLLLVVYAVSLLFLSHTLINIIYNSIEGKTYSIYSRESIMK